MKMACLHVGVMGVAAMRVVLHGAGITEAGKTPRAEGNSTTGEVGAEAGVTTSEAGVTSAMVVSMAGVQGGAISAASKRKHTLSLATDQSLMDPHIDMLVPDWSSSLNTCLLARVLT